MTAKSKAKTIRVICTSITPFGSFQYKCNFDEHDDICNQIDAEVKGLSNFNRLEVLRGKKG
jgi:hypothetical protein